MCTTLADFGLKSLSTTLAARALHVEVHWFSTSGKWHLRACEKVKVDYSTNSGAISETSSIFQYFLMTMTAMIRIILEHIFLPTPYQQCSLLVVQLS